MTCQEATFSVLALQAIICVLFIKREISLSAKITSCQSSFNGRFMVLLIEHFNIYYLMTGPEGNSEFCFNPFTPKSNLIDLTLSNAKRFYSSKGDPLGVKGLALNGWSQGEQ